MSARRLGGLRLALPVLGLVVGLVVGAMSYTCPDDAADCDLGPAYALVGGVVGGVAGLVVAAVVTVALWTRSRRARVGPPTA